MISGSSGFFAAVFAIFIRDLRRILTRPFAVIIILGACLLPSLYAWYIIAANWDPYSNTENIKVAVVDEDTGASSELVGHIDVGHDLVEKLEGNHELGWETMSHDEAIQRVEMGDCYAAIIIPADFSESFLGIFEGKQDEPELDYYVNEKISAAAPKITDEGATTLENEIDRTFIDIVGATVVELSQKAGVKVRDEGSQGMQELSDGITTATSSIDSTQAIIEEMLPILDSSITGLEEWSESASTIPSDLHDLVIRIEDVSAGLASAQQEMDSYLDSLPDNLPPFDSGDMGTPGKDAFDMANGLYSFDKELLEADAAMLGDVSSTLSDLAGIIDTLIPLAYDSETMLARTVEVLKTIEQSSLAASGSLEDMREGLGSLLDDLRMIQASDTAKELSTYLSMDPDSIAGFLSQPVTLRTEVVFPVKNYGSGVAPFFSNLGLWVAGLILVALIRLRSDPEDLPGLSRPPTQSQTYLGRWLLFALLSLIQGTMLCLGDVLIGIQCESPVAFIGAGMLACLVYDSMIFALAYAFKHIGKAVAVILLIVQIPGSSGLYPIQMMPEFFRILEPVLPFTYSIDAMRQAIGGMYGLSYLWDMLALTLFMVPAFLIGLVVGKADYNVNIMFDQQLGKTGVLVTERMGRDQRKRRYRLRHLVNVLLDADGYRMDVSHRISWFQRHYVLLMRIGWVALFAQPMIMVALMLAIPMDVNTKVWMLAIMVLGIILVDIYLVLVRFTRMDLGSQYALANLEGNDLHRLAHDVSGTASIRSSDGDGEQADEGSEIPGRTSSPSASASEEDAS